MQRKTYVTLLQSRVGDGQRLAFYVAGWRKNPVKRKAWRVKIAFIPCGMNGLRQRAKVK
ncbi:hypothetical protein BN137_3575 [Cronobacter condimenti 1330]|uniref:Uncharacterized protein n=1 Tax=Cronobacter condimenti 1330 TaxID=1073999 RepID=K8A2W4_9ENTR|nr:hypothetical protein BN137_3575 [Cronobacter condimenti 1330]